MLKNLIKEILKEEILGKPTVAEYTSINSPFVGRKVMVRTYSAGVHFGTLEEKVGQEAVLSGSRRVYSWQGAATLSQLAMEGSNKIVNCKITMEVKEILLNRVIEVIPLTDKAIENLYGAEVWKL